MTLAGAVWRGGQGALAFEVSKQPYCLALCDTSAVWCMLDDLVCCLGTQLAMGGAHAHFCGWFTCQ